MFLFSLRTWLFALTPAVAVCAGCSSAQADDRLSELVHDTAPWTHLEANSEQRQPVYVGSSPRQMQMTGQTQAEPTLPSQLKAIAEKQLTSFGSSLCISTPCNLEFEIWPVQTDDGTLAWAMPRWKSLAHSDGWHWFSSRDIHLKIGSHTVLPVTYELSSPRSEHQIFADFLELNDLYAKPVFGDCVFVDAKGNIENAWLPLETRTQVSASLRGRSDLKCLVIPQPARLNTTPISFIVELDGSKIVWPKNLSWIPEAAKNQSPLPSSLKLSPIDTQIGSVYRDDVLALSGETVLKFPVSRKTITLKRKNSADPYHQILDLVSYLEERYQTLGIETARMPFKWRGIPQANLIAYIRGKGPNASVKPILMADHIDTAFCEDEFARSGRRISAPGADDNLTAVAALLQAAEYFKKNPPERDVWLVHLTGEEFPGDDLGAREFIKNLLATKQDIGGLVLMDMIGYTKTHDRIFQISAGGDSQSLAMARTALDVALKESSILLPVIRLRDDPKSYLYNTDGVTFADAGFPVILLNEHLNAYENINRPHYHQTTDVASLLNWDFALAATRTAIYTAARLAAQ